MKAKGADSLFVLGATRGEARGAVTHELRMHWLAMSGFAALIVAEIYLLVTH
jgi:hypothetical protein